jgi:hypothetical protein
MLQNPWRTLPPVETAGLVPGVAGWPVRRACALRRLAATLLVTGAVGAVCAGSGQETAAPEAAASGPPSLAIEALSRGAGVPEAAKTTLADARSMLEALQAQGTDLRISQERIGLEGETRLCAQFADPQQAEQAFERLSQIVQGVDLVNLTRGPCGAAKP